LDEEMSKLVGLAQQNQVDPTIFAQLAKACKRCIKALHLLKKRVINMI